MRRGAAFVWAAFALMCSSGCQPYADPNTCVDWVWFESAQEQFDEATLVVEGTPLQRNGTTRIYGHEAQAHLINVETVHKGEVEPGELRISSMPQACGDAPPYPGGDPLDTEKPLLIYARAYEGDWYTLTPEHGVQSHNSSGELPFNSP